MQVPVIDVMSAKIVSVKPSVSVLEAVKKMISAGLGNVLVMVGDELRGILTEKDVIAKVVAKGLDPAVVKVSKVMTSKVVTIRPSLNLQEAARKMTGKGIRRLPVVSKGKVIGVLTMNDVLRVQPGLVDVLSERLKYSQPKFDGSRVGVCEVCNSFSKRLIRVNGRLVCSNCKKEI